MSEMQMVALGRMRVNGAVVVIDDSVGSVLQADCKLLSCLLNAGAARIVSLADIDTTHRHFSQEFDYVFIVGDLSDSVHAAILALQVRFTAKVCLRGLPQAPCFVTWHTKWRAFVSRLCRHCAQVKT
jgi:hypothetical protein